MKALLKREPICVFESQSEQHQKNETNKHAVIMGSSFLMTVCMIHHLDVVMLSLQR